MNGWPQISEEGKGGMNFSLRNAIECIFFKISISFLSCLKVSLTSYHYHVVEVKFVCLTEDWHGIWSRVTSLIDFSWQS